jgi:hypothetical protein
VEAGELLRAARQRAGDDPRYLDLSILLYQRATDVRLARLVARVAELHLEPAVVDPLHAAVDLARPEPTTSWFVGDRTANAISEFALAPLAAAASRFPFPRFANPRERRGYVTAACAVHFAALPANIIEGDSRVLLYPAKPAPNTNTRRGDSGGFLCHGWPLVAAGGDMDRAHPLSQSPL